MAEESSFHAQTPGERAKARRTLLLITAVALAPIVASTVAYYFFPRAARVNYGRLLTVAPVSDIEGTRLDRTPFRLSQLKGKWILVQAAEGACDSACRRELYATRQARTIQGPEQDRVVRVWLVPNVGNPAPAVLSEHPGLIVARVRPEALRQLPAGGDAIYLVDPVGNLVLQYPQDPDIKGMSRDLKRLLSASQIG